MKFWDLYIKLIITQCIAVLLIILTLLTVKICFKKSFENVKNFYFENILSDTDINEVLKGEI